MVVVSVEELSLLIIMQRDVGRIEIQDHLVRFLLKTVEENLAQNFFDLLC